MLQGEGVTIILDGKTQIEAASPTGASKRSPDAPFTTVRSSARPEGPNSRLRRERESLQHEVRCPPTLTAQNGAVITQTTLVEPEGCANKLTILSHTVKKRTITLKVAVPGAGKLTATGKGLSKATKPPAGPRDRHAHPESQGVGQAQNQGQGQLRPEQRQEAQRNRRGEVQAVGRRGFRDLRAVEVSAGRMTR